MNEPKLPIGVSVREGVKTVTSFMQSKILQEFGLVQHSDNFYFHSKSSEEPTLYSGRELDILIQLYDAPVITAAYSTDQLIAALGSVAASLSVDEDNKGSFVVHYKDPISGMKEFSGDNLPDTLADLLASLLERKRKPLEEANRWLMYV